MIAEMQNLGRPLSHIALFALKHCYRYDTMLLERFRPTLEEPAPVGRMLERLDAYYESDRVPRVRSLIAAVRSQLLGETG